MASTLHHPWRLDAPSRAPADVQEAVELADLVQAFAGDDDDPVHTVWAEIVAPWQPAPCQAQLIDDSGKLVRDGIPAIVREQGLVPLVLPCRDLGERYRRLLDKLLEERDEYAEHVVEHDVGDLLELADMLEVVETLAFLDGHSLADVREAQIAKREERGGFADWTVWFGNVPATTRAV